MTGRERGPGILVVGEALVDIVRRADGVVTETPGGSPANVALTLGRLGRAPHLLSAIGVDRRGEEVRRWLGESGVAVGGTILDRTSTAVAALDRHGAATYEFAVDWHLSAEDAPSEAEVLHVGSIAAVRDPGATAVSEIVDRHRGRSLIAVDPNVRTSLIDDPETARSRIRSLLARADVIKASDEDIAWLHPGEDLRTAARGMLHAGAILVVITRGEAGVIALRGDDELRVPARPVAVVDTVGAGDTFMGALLDGLLEHGVSGAASRARLHALDRSVLVEILARSARAAAITVSRPGADPPTRGDLDAERVARAARDQTDAARRASQPVRTISSTE